MFNQISQNQLQLIKYAIVFELGAVAVLVSQLAYRQTNSVSDVGAVDYDSCANLAGSKILETYPAKCVDLSGQTFTQQIVDEPTTPDPVIDNPEISIEDSELLAGWYWGAEDQKKLGTPEDWIFSQADGGSCWHEASVECAFVAPTTGVFKYQCPKTSWVDCMPTSDRAGMKFECTDEYLKWATANCPNFEGAAY